MNTINLFVMMYTWICRTERYTVCIF